MATAWKPSKGQVALVEIDGNDEDILTGLVLDGDGPVLVDLGASPRPTSAEFNVIASFFAPEALYRIHAAASYEGGSGVIELAVRQVETVQRRAASRARVSLPVELSMLDEPAFAAVCPGETVDVAPGGVRITTTQPLPADLSEPALSIQLPEGERVVAIAQVLEEQRTNGQWQYRLSFAQISEPDAERLAELA